MLGLVDGCGRLVIWWMDQGENNQRAAKMRHEEMQCSEGRTSDHKTALENDGVGVGFGGWLREAGNLVDGSRKAEACAVCL